MTFIIIICGNVHVTPNQLRFELNLNKNCLLITGPDIANNVAPETVCIHYKSASRTYIWCQYYSNDDSQICVVDSAWDNPSHLKDISFFLWADTTPTPITTWVSPNLYKKNIARQNCSTLILSYVDSRAPDQPAQSDLRATLSAKSMQSSVKKWLIYTAWGSDEIKMALIECMFTYNE